MAKKNFRYTDVGLWIIYKSFLDALLIQLLLSCVWSVSTLATITPAFNRMPSNVTFYRGETAIMPCSVRNLGSSSVVWKRLDEPHVLTVGEFAFVSDPKFSVKHIPFREEWNLIIDDVEPKHSGRYECQISTKEDLVRYIDLKVIDEPGHESKHVNIDGPRLVEKGHPIRLTCNASGFSRSPKDINWYISGRLLYTGIEHNLRIITYQRSDMNSMFSELHMTKSDTEDSGTYICQTIFHDNVVKIVKHKLLVINGDSNQTKRGTMADNSIHMINNNNDKQTASDSKGSSCRIHKVFLQYLFTIMVAWCFLI